MKQTPLVISFYTKHTPYEKEAVEFIASCERYGVDYEVEAIDSLGAWDRNCAFKPTFILKKLQEKKRAILWVDIDGRFVAPFHGIDLEDCDLALRVNAHLPEGDDSRFYTGTIYCNYTKTTIRLLEAWVHTSHQLFHTHKRAELWDQQILRQIFPKHSEVHFRALPWRFAKIFDLDADVIFENKTVIEHRQASRTHKQWVNIEPVSKERLNYLETAFAFIKQLRITAMIEVSEENLDDLGTSLYSLFPYIDQMLVAGRFTSQSHLEVFSQIAKIYPKIPFITWGIPDTGGLTFLLQSHHKVDGVKFFIWLTTGAWQRNLPVQFGNNGPLLYAEGLYRDPTIIEADIFIDPKDRKEVDLFQHPILASTKKLGLIL
ncbi:MAG: hypothetical protein KGZ37_00060 [Nitrosarchaeum sp.]|nr:hypothetical protein [Nitrosarchaeum sp.]